MPSGGSPELYRVGDLVIDVTGACVSRRGERLVLPPRTFELLVALVRRYPATVRRPELLDSVWHDEIVSDQTLSHRVMVLRKALGDHADEPAYVAGERGFGYRLVAPAVRIDSGVRAPAAEPGSRASRVHRTLPLIAAGAAGFALLAAWLSSGGGTSLPRRAAESARLASPGGAATRAARLDRTCLRGEFFFLSFTEEGLRRSAEAWEQALALEPRHARAYAGKAMTASVRALLDLLPPAEAERAARDGARRALELDPASPATLLASSLVRLLFEWDGAAAANIARAAVAAGPDDLRGPVVLGLALQGQGRLDECERVLDAASLDDPYSAGTAFLEGRAHQMRAHWGQAMDAYERALALEPELRVARRGRAESLTAAGRRLEALAELGAAGAVDGDAAGALSAHWIRLCRAGAPSGETLRACVLGGERDRAERLLLAAVAARAPFVVLAPHEALLQPLRPGPAMSALIARLQQPLPLSRP